MRAADGRAGAVAAPAAPGRQPGPSMSVVVVTADGLRSIRRTLACLLAQTVRERLELVVVGPAGGRLLPERSELDGLWSTRAVELPAIERSAPARAAGALACSAPVIAFVEEHSYPDPDWARRLLEAFEHGWAAVGPRVRNANPGARVARADFEISYGRWARAPGGESDDLPGHNSAYRRDVLLAYGDRLPDVLQAETLLHWELRRRGERLALEPRAAIEHASVARLRPWIVKRLLTGRLFASRRSARWSPGRRAAYVLASPLIPALRVRRMRAQGAPGAGARALTVAGLGLEALGEAIGYAAGPGRSEARLLRFELRRGEEFATG